jgi:hypothetical protein
MAPTERDWQEQAKALLRAELTRRQMTVRDLAERLQEIGAGNARTVENKIARGSFSAGFFIQCLAAIGVKALRLDTE